MSLDKEIMDGFHEETMALLGEASALVSQMDEQVDFTAASVPISEFAIRIDRIMGAAKTIVAMDPNHSGLKKIGSLAQICKSISYKSIDKKAVELLPLMSAFFSDVIECMEGLLATMNDEKDRSSHRRFLPRCKAA